MDTSDSLDSFHRVLKCKKSGTFVSRIYETKNEVRFEYTYDVKDAYTFHGRHLAYEFLDYRVLHNTFEIVTVKSC